MKKNNRIEDILDKSIDQLKKGKSIHDCLQAFPEYAQELAPVLAAAEKLSSISAEKPHSCNLAQTIEKVREAAEQMKAGRSSLRPFFSFYTAARLSAAACFMILMLTGILAVSYRSLPGDSFYPMKLLCENIDLDYLTAKNKKAAKHIELADKRLNEVQKVAQTRHSIDKDALHAMHVHTEMALNAVDSIDDSQVVEYLNRIEQLHRRQIGMLKKAQADNFAQNLNEINQSIQLCNDRMDWVRQSNEAESELADAKDVQ